jgi:hypothetical protein
MSSPSPDFLGSPEVDLRRTENNVFEGRFPDPAELLQWGGQPGVHYLLVDSGNVHDAQRAEPIIIDDVPCRWGPTKGADFYTIIGPKGEATAVLLSRGKPIPHADPANGVREWYYDRSLLQTTGLKSPYGGPEEDLPPVPTAYTKVSSKKDQ